MEEALVFVVGPVLVQRASKPSCLVDRRAWGAGAGGHGGQLKTMRTMCGGMLGPWDPNGIQGLIYVNDVFKIKRNIVLMS